jgi:hypothetical protein
MRIILLIVIALVVVGGGAYYAFNRGGGLSEAEVAAALAERAAQINAADGERFDDFSQLVSARAVERQITIRGESLLNQDALPEGYLDTRRLQAARILCEDDQTRAVMAGGATHVFNWWSADDQSIGMVTLRGEAVCDELGF